MKVKGVVLNKTLSSNPGYWLLCPNAKQNQRFVFVDQWATQSDYALGDSLSVEGSEKKSEEAKFGCTKIDADEITLLSSSEHAYLSAQANALIEKECAPLSPTPKLFFDDTAMQRLAPEFDRVARLLAERVFTLSPILIRHHDDADGITSGLLVKHAVLDFARRASVPFPKNFLRSEWTDYAIYDAQRVLEDRNWALGFQKKPLLLLLDHGGNTDSFEAVKEANSFFDVVVVDHHPPADQLRFHCLAFVNAFFAGGGSRHTTGLLCFEVARRMQRSPREEFLWISLEGDHSDYRKRESGWASSRVLALEYLSQTKHSLDDCEKLFSDEQTLDLYYKKARTAIEDMLTEARKNTKVMRVPRRDGAGDAIVQVARLGFLKKNSFPSKSLAINEVHNAVEYSDAALAVVSIGFINDSLSFRGSKPAGALGFKANEIIERLKKQFGSAVRSGGGHELAASMRFDADAGAKILEAAVEEAKRALSG
ncbi:MAG: DHH family phosphoesterase [Candidatus Norongarragalinales archaeon]